MMDIDTTTGDVITSTFDNLPTGWYAAQAIEGALEAKGDGTRLNLTWEIIEGQFEKRRVWQSEWAQHTSGQAQEIGQRMIRTIGQAVGVGKVERPEDLMFKPVEIRVGLNKKQDGYEQRNEVKSARKYSAVGTAGAATTATAGAPASTPWGKKAAA